MLEASRFRKRLRELVIISTFVFFEILIELEIVGEHSVHVIRIEVWFEAVLDIGQEHLQHVHKQLAYLGRKHCLVLLQLVLVLVWEGIVELGYLVVLQVHDGPDVVLFTFDDWELHVIGKTPVNVANSHIHEVGRLYQLLKLIKILD